MARKTFNRVRHSTATVGQGTLTLGAAYSNRFATFAEAGIADGDTVMYCIEEGNDFEIGTGTYTSAGTTLTRATVHLSKISGTAGTTKLTLAANATVRGIVSALDMNEALWARTPAVDVASGATTNIGAAASQHVRITGTTTITAFDTVEAGIFRTGYFAGILTFTHGAALLLPGAANITTAANDRFSALSLGSGNWLVLSFTKADGKAVVPPSASDLATGTLPDGRLSSAALAYGKQCIPVPALAMYAPSSGGPAAGTAITASNSVQLNTLDFDGSSAESAYFSIPMPSSWNEGTVTFQPIFSQLTTAAGAVVFELSATASSDGDSIDVAYGTAQTSTKTAGTLNVNYTGPESAAITVAGTPAAGDLVHFRLKRLPTDGGDTLAQDARLHGIKLFITTDAGHD